jgi:hypothetical protein
MFFTGNFFHWRTLALLSNHIFLIWTILIIRFVLESYS